MTSHRRFFAILTGIYAVVWVATALDPAERDVWLLENLLVFVFVGLMAVTARSFAFSRLSYALIILFLCLHSIGAHYTYSLVPYDAWSEALTGRSVSELFGWQRNHYDRLIHFTYGLLLAYPVREVFLRIANVRGFWGYFLPLDLTMSSSLLYELIEWGAAVTFGGDLGMEFLGTQGDIWDGHKDMALAGLGALIAMVVTALINVALKRDFTREWIESLRVKDRRPLGEDEIARMWKDRSSE
jgi:putative membrane protein